MADTGTPAPMISPTTMNGVIKGIIVALTTVHAAQDTATWWFGLAYAVLTAVQGYLTQDKTAS